MVSLMTVPWWSNRLGSAGLLALTLVVLAPLGQARAADELTPRYRIIGERAREAKWQLVLDELAKFEPGAPLDYRYFYWRALAFYHLGWVKAGNWEEQVAKKFLSAAELDESKRKPLLAELENARKEAENALPDQRVTLPCQQASLRLIGSGEQGGVGWTGHEKLEAGKFQSPLERLEGGPNLKLLEPSSLRIQDNSPKP